RHDAEGSVGLNGDAVDAVAAVRPSERLRSGRQRDLPDKAGENEHAAQAVALALIRQEQATEADERGERHSDLTSSVHVLFPQSYPPINVAGDDCFLILLEAFVFGRRRVRGET